MKVGNSKRPNEGEWLGALVVIFVIVMLLLLIVIESL